MKSVENMSKANVKLSRMFCHKDNMMEKTQLLVKNVLKLDTELKRLFTIYYGAIEVKNFGRCRLKLSFPDEQSATRALHTLHQTEFYGRILSVEYLNSQKSINITENKQQIVSENPIKLPQFIRNLYAINAAHGFEQPPSPCLKYNYPPINRTILDSISIALLTNSKFYHQVLHLMNRMNLDPPFLPLQKPFIPPGESCHAQTQTDFVDRTINKNKKKLLASDESELESDDESIRIQSNKKRKQPPTNDFVIKTKLRKIISSQLYEKQHQSPSLVIRKEHNILEIFEDAKRDTAKKISLNVADVKLPEGQEAMNLPTVDVENAIESSTFDEPLNHNRIPENQLKDLQVFKNYQRGEKSNKLYIKNLAKEVTETDLVNLYNRFAKSKTDIDVKLMLFGKMKGQAFVTFDNLAEDKFEAVERALDETNGYILKSKPMVVCFGKKS